MDESIPPISDTGLPARHSKSADAARRRQIERELAMTPMERMLLALRLGVVAEEIAKAARKS